MSEKVSFVSNDDIEKKINIVMNQTDYTRDVIKEKLEKNNYDEILTIKEYFGISKKVPKISSLNQEIYKQIRYKLDGSMKEYNSRKLE